MYTLIVILLTIKDIVFNIATFGLYGLWQGAKSSGARFPETKNSKGERMRVVRRIKN